MIPAKLLAVTTAVPPFALDQADVMRRVQAQFGDRSTTVARLLPVFANTGIERRYSCVPIEWYYEPHDWPDRNRIYLESSLELLETAARSALNAAKLDAGDIDSVVTVSTSGIATPSLDAQLAQRMGFRRTLRRLPIFGLGCAGGTIGLARAAELATAYPQSRVLFLVVELCTLSFRREDTSKSNIVATALFSDGAAAALLSTRGSGPALVASSEYTFPDTLDVMGWEVEKDGLKAIFSRDIPALIESELGAILDTFLAERGLVRSDLTRVLAHPGGAKVIDAIESVVGVANGSLTESRGVLRDFGNMSAATVMFVIERAIREHRLAPGSCGRTLISAMGPGFTAALALLENP